MHSLPVPQQNDENDAHKTQMIRVCFLITCQMSFLSQTTLTLLDAPHITAAQIAAGNTDIKA